MRVLQSLITSVCRSQFCREYIGTHIPGAPSTAIALSHALGAELREERLRIEAELAALEETPVPLALHPATLDRYIETVNALADTMAGHVSAEDDRGPLVDDFRALVHGVIVHPKGPWQGFEVRVKGKPAALVGGRVFPEAHHNSGSHLVAGGRFI